MELIFEHFRDRVGRRFPATAADGTSLDLELTEASERAANPNASQGFALLFRAGGQEVVDQQTFDVELAELGTHPIFLVPIAVNDDGVSYEAVFSR